ncbi:MAG: hypothetical protein DI626_01145 [Micavibrio aeruginosavorus]|uniref:Uncharacterized protein n=1 Tax=Micavibrio aeruginosavorus TaxID=349221 RepID=A0A2W5C3L7_9BACT|nr:MAG: hypothetical protein DI626_01145 [Micavibrio aeruginosavorus]
MSETYDNWSKMKKLKHSLLKRAFNENRGAEVILLIQWRRALESHKNEGFVKIARKFLEENACQPRAIRALNLIAESKGLNVVYKEAVEKPGVDIMAYIRDMKKEDQILLPELPKKPLTYLGTPEQFGIRKLSDAEQIYQNSRKPIGDQREVRMDDEEIAVPVKQDHGSLTMLSADKPPRGYKMN